MPTCGPVNTVASGLTCGVSEADEAALCELMCPTCQRNLMVSFAPVEIKTLLLLGARRAGRLPFELLEKHTGPTLSWDEILEAHFELEAQPFPQQELTRDPA